MQKNKHNDNPYSTHRQLSIMFTLRMCFSKLFSDLLELFFCYIFLEDNFFIVKCIILQQKDDSYSISNKFQCSLNQPTRQTQPESIKLSRLAVFVYYIFFMGGSYFDMSALFVVICFIHRICLFFSTYLLLCDYVMQAANATFV